MKDPARAQEGTRKWRAADRGRRWKGTPLMAQAPCTCHLGTLWPMRNGADRIWHKKCKSGKLQGIVVVEKTQMSEQYFPAMQKFTVLDLGMVLLPVASQMEASCLLIQLVQEQAKEPSKNPLLRKKRALISEPALLRTVQQIPGVGKVKAPLLLQRFPSLQQLSNASIQELEPVVGQAVAQHIHAFFTQSR
ncbi:Fanconi anemia core complex-associated protein 24 isoform X2 [Vicugna pacos]|uniref:Fanconi anemia core complex-associated protein 24 isoform X2 n=1 Tax=Vicugna pacos TaxID=30538 RepID=A0A6J3A510_VICPA|nr:Fanconi anemia core complex-associated protein 24 isoform X2 [Vicugna pacos]